MVGPITFTPAEIGRYYAARAPHLKQRRGAERRGPCPIHRGKHDNFAVDPETGGWFCHSRCGRGGDILDLEAELHGGDFETRKAEVFRIIGRPESPNGNRPARARIVETYDYTDEAGQLLFQTVRMDPKDFKQRRPNGSGGWIWNLKGVRTVLYRLPQLLKRPAETVFICEGEKDTHSLEALGSLATCNPMGAGKWRAEYSETLRGRHVVIPPDNDEAGRKHAATVAAALLNVAASVRIVELPGLPPKGDVTDWRDAGGTFERFRELTDAAAPLTAAALSELRTRWGLADKEPQQARAEAAAHWPNAGSIITRRVSDIEAKPVSWLWPGRIPRGKLTIIAGNPGLGKSQITASIAAVVTTGGHWPVDASPCTPGDVIFLTAEDDAADTLRPRLEAAGADLTRVHIIEGVVIGYTGEGVRRNRVFSLQQDVPSLSAKLAELRSVAAVFVDPISAYLGDTDSHKNAEVRGLLTPLSELAAQHCTSIVGVSHLSKAGGVEALMRVSGSLAFVAAARAAYLVAPDPDNKARRFFLPMKNNLAADIGGLAYRIEGATVQSNAGPLETSRVMWEAGPITVTADELMLSSVPQKTTALSEAKSWLGDTLAAGPMPAAEILDRAKASTLSPKTVRRACKALGITPKKEGMNGGWTWSLPPKVAKVPEDAQEKNLGTLGESGHLRETGGGMAEEDL